MADFCIPKIQATKLLNKLKGDGIDKLNKMSSSEKRRMFFADAIGETMARKVNAAFEKALAKNTKEAMVEFAKKITGTDGAEIKSIVDRINKLEDKALLEGNILEDYVSEFLGVNITTEEVAKLRTLSKTLGDAEKKMNDSFQNVLDSGKITKEYQDSLVQYAKALQKSDEFLVSKTSNDWSSTLWNHAKALMLTNPASWGVNIESNIIQAITTAVERRFKNLRLTGYSSDLAKEWKKTMLAVRKETGYDLSRSLSIDELLEKKVMGENPSIGKDTWFTKLIYNGALGAPDAWSARMAFADALDLETASIAKGMGFSGKDAEKKAREIFIDATQVVPTTAEGKLARQIAVQEAQFATWSNSGLIAKNTLRMKSALNSFVEKGLGLRGFKLGDMIEPFVKTPANISQYGLDASAIGIIRGMGKFASLMKNHKAMTSIQKRTLFGEALRDSLRTGFGVGGALMLASMIDNDNFVGAYDPNRWKYEQLRNSNANSIRIGDRWYSLDYAGGFAAPLVAVLYARKYGNENLASMVSQYFIGVADQITRIPFVGSVWDIGREYNRSVDPDNPKSSQQALATIYQIFSDQITSRVPGLLSNIAKLSDDNQREANGFWQTLQEKIPFWREQLPTKQDMFGQELLTEMGMNKSGTDQFIAAITQIMAGARIKTAKDTPYGKEIIRLRDVGESAALTSWKYRLGKRQSALKEKVGEEKYREIYRDEYGKVITEQINKLIENDRYKKLKDSEKKKEIEKLDDTLMKKIYSKYKIDLRN